MCVNCNTTNRILIAASSGVGKSHLICQILKFKELVFSEKFDDIYVFMPEGGKIADKDFVNEVLEYAPNAKIFDGFDGNIEKYGVYSSGNGPKLLIFEDVIAKLSKDADFLETMIRRCVI